MTNLEYISSSPELFIKFIKSIKDDQSNPNPEEYSKFIDWLSAWATSSALEDNRNISVNQIWLLKKVEKLSDPSTANSDKYIWNRLIENDYIEIKGVIEESYSKQTKIVYQSLKPNTSLHIISKNELLTNGILTKESSSKSLLIKDIGLSERSFNVLRRAGIMTLDQLCSKNIDEFIHMKSQGRKSSLEIIDKLEELYKLENYKWILDSTLVKTYHSENHLLKQYRPDPFNSQQLESS